MAIQVLSMIVDICHVVEVAPHALSIFLRGFMRGFAHTGRRGVKVIGFLLLLSGWAVALATLNLLAPFWLGAEFVASRIATEGIGLHPSEEPHPFIQRCL